MVAQKLIRYKVRRGHEVDTSQGKLREARAEGNSGKVESGEEKENKQSKLQAGE